LLGQFFALSTVLWALEAWDLISLEWVDPIEEWFDSLWLSILELEFINRPLTATENVLAALSEDRRFNPENDGLVLLFMWFVYPLVWNFTVPLDLINILTLPVLIILYLFDENLFIDAEAT